MLGLESYKDLLYRLVNPLSYFSKLYLSLILLVKLLLKIEVSDVS